MSVTQTEQWSLSFPPDKELVLELEAMRAKHGVCGRERSPSRLDAFVRSLEEERDRYRREAQRYRRAAGGGGGPDSSPTRSPPSRTTRVRDRRITIRSTFSRCVIACPMASCSGRRRGGGATASGGGARRAEGGAAGLRAAHGGDRSYI